MPATQRKCIYGDLTLDVDRHYIENVTATTHQDIKYDIILYSGVARWRKVEGQKFSPRSDKQKKKKKKKGKKKTRGPKGHISCTWVQCATFCVGIGQGGHFCLLIGPKNKNSEEDVEILLPVKFRWILFSGFRGEVENVSANQRSGRPSYLSDRPEKHTLRRGRWDLASCQVSLNSVQRFQRGIRKCLSQSEARAAILFFRLARKIQTW